MSNTIPYTLHADVVPDDAPPGLWVDTAAKLLRIAAAEIERLTAENERLRAALIEALDIADGSGADFNWRTQERLRDLRSVSQQQATKP